MNASDQVLRDGACCAMELAARRGSVALEKALRPLNAQK